jgi:hypothetical protein
MNNNLKPLFLLNNGDKFIHDGITYTVYSHEGNMCEVFRKNEFKCWPTWNGKGPTMVNFVQQTN